MLKIRRFDNAVKTERKMAAGFVARAEDKVAKAKVAAIEVVKRPALWTPELVVAVGGTA